VFSDDSSETEYTSSLGEDGVHENGNCVESKPKDTSIQASAPVALSSISHIKMENLTTPQQGSPLRIPSLKGEIVPNRQTPAARPLISMPRMGIKSTPLKERHEIKDGKTVVVVDLDDSDEDTDAPLTETSPLCTKCRHDHEQQHKQPKTKVQNCPLTQVIPSNARKRTKMFLKHLPCFSPPCSTLLVFMFALLATNIAKSSFIPNQLFVSSVIFIDVLDVCKCGDRSV